MREAPLLHQHITESIIGAFYDAYNGLRFGFLESAYAAALDELLRERGHTVVREALVDVYCRGKAIAKHRLDMVVDGKVIVEIKSTEILHQTAHRQLLSYLKSTELDVGLLLHFGPEPRFYRAVTTKKLREQNDQTDSA